MYIGNPIFLYIFGLIILHIFDTTNCIQPGTKQKKRSSFDFFEGATRATFSSSLSSDDELVDEDDDEVAVAFTGAGGVASAFFLFLLLVFFLAEDVVSFCCFFVLASLDFLFLFAVCFDEEFDFVFVDDEKKSRVATV